MKGPHPVVLGVSGASGAAIAMRIAERLRAIENVETHLVISKAAQRTLAHELDKSAADRLVQLADYVHAINDIGAKIASGSFRTKGMIIAPCSMRTLGAIATSLSDNLLVRAGMCI